MSQLLWQLLKATPVFLGASLLVANSSIAAQTSAAQTAAQQTAEPIREFTPELSDRILAQAAPNPRIETTQSPSQVLDQIERYNNLNGVNQEFESDPMGQVTNVDQLRDVSPTEWAYEALRSLVERYGCIVGYPDQTFRGNRALTRWEFAAGLNACMEQMERLIAATEAVLREDIEKLQRLAREFEVELASLRGRVDNLEGRVAFLEDHQFSTTTKLKGEVIIAGVAQGTSDDRKFDGSDERVEEQATLSNRVRLRLDTSFTGKDLLITRLQARNVPRLDRAFGTDMARLGFDGDEDNDVRLNRAYYRFPIGERITTWVGAEGTDIDEIFDVINPFLESSGSGALSRFSRRNPLVYRGPEGGGGGISYEFSEKLDITALYLAEDAEDPSPGRGLFNGAFSTGTQLTYSPTERLDLAATYLYTYQPKGEVNLTGSTGSRLTDDVADELNFAGSRDPFNGAATFAHRVGVQGSWRITDGINWAAWLGWANATGQSDDNTGVDRKNDIATLWTWSTNFSFVDLGREGAVLSISGGQLPRAPKVSGGLQDRNVAYTVEALYKYPLTDNITITPGGYVIFNPNHEDNNDTIYVGVVRTTFKF